MNVLKVLAVALGLMFAITVADSYACDKHKTSAKSECSTEMKKTSANAESSKSCCTTAKKTAAKSECCSTKKTASAKSECCSTKKATKLEASNKESNNEVKTAEAKPISN